ncbi:MAG TPA: hypothetical protein PLZ08_06345 [Bacillota bacterium]|mgnify:CR=1 FL=1|jgi:nitrogen regulatory protein PII|nr:hypothetical protein [Bacillota bacterium]HOL09877.1 hypothetical protein [Bacillota bacterium]HPO97563.1 hypothetical protein [Bacillota bacterium]
MENWQALFIVISDSEKTERVLEILLESEIRGATIVESMGMGKMLADNIPVFGSLRNLLSRQHETSQTIFAVSKHPDKIEKAMEQIAKEFDGFQEPCTGMMFVVPVCKAVGIGKKE